MYKGHMNKAKGDWITGGRWGWVGQRGVMGRKWRHLYLNNNLKKGEGIDKYRLVVTK